VLELLKDEFPDITISKIRFLESQGLLDPERTPSGYRKFYEPDVARLRWILRQQKEHFLPLKVIKGRLSEEVAPEPEAAAAVDVAEPAREAPAPPEEPAPEARPGGRSSPLVAGSTAVSLTLDELCAATGLDHAALKELEQFGLLVGRPVAGQVYYDEEALVAGRLAAGFARHGVEARHLRMYKVAAEREAGFYEQVVLPLLKQRNPTARRQAVESLEELARLGEGMRAAFLRAALREYTE
jgi:DNA-binding transcriptional MerR regulator